MKTPELPTMLASWTTKEQLALLQAELPGFCTAQQLQLGPIFMKGLAEHWFKKWPESDTLVPSTVDEPMPIPSEEDENITKAIAR